MRDEDKTKAQLINELRALRANIALEDHLHLAGLGNEQLRAIINAMHDSMLVLNTDGRVVLMNRHLAEFIGVNPEDAFNYTIYDLLPADIAEARMSKYLSALLKRELVQFEDERQGRKYHHSVFPVYDADSQNNLLIVFIQEITFSWQIRRAQARVQKYLDIASAMLVSLNREGNIVFINQAGCELLGYERSDLLGRNWFDTCIPARMREEIKTVFRKLIDGTSESVGYYENPVLTQSGEERLIAWYNSLVTIDDSGEIEGILSSGIDITEHKKAELALLANEAKTRAILEALPDLMFRLSRDATHLEFYAPHEDMLFVRPEEFLGKRVEEVLPPEAARLYHENIQQTLDTKTVQVFEYHLDFTGKKRSYYEARMVVAGEDEVLVIVRDITRRKWTHEQQIKLAVQQDRIQLLEEIITDLSHDIRTPLASIKTNLYLLEKQPDPEKRRKYMGTMDAQILHLTKLVDEILVMFRLDKGVNLTFTLLNLNTLIRNIGSEFRGLIEKKKLRAVFDIDFDLPRIMGSESELIRCFTQLIENAINYTPVGGSVLVKTMLTEKNIVVEVSDTGIGIEEEDLPRIFEHFYRADKARNSNQGGTGLGLAIVKRIVELHRGTIEVESVVDKGSTFRVRLPSKLVDI